MQANANKSHKDSSKIVSQSAGRRPEKAVGNAASVHAADCRVQGGCVLSCDALSFLSLSCVLVYLDDVVISGIFFSAVANFFFRIFQFFCALEKIGWHRAGLYPRPFANRETALIELSRTLMLFKGRK